MIAENGDRRLIVSHSGLRGRAGIGLDDRVVGNVVGGLLSLLSERGLPAAIGVARDARPSGEHLAAHAIDEAIRRGADVVDFDVASTPAAKLAVRSRGLGAGIIVTGSHLGPRWNGLKLIAAPDYWPLDPRLLPPVLPGPVGPAGRLSHDRGAAYQHAVAVCEPIDLDAVRRARMRVSLRGGCGEAPRIAFERLGCSLVHADADIGFVLDEDADRLQLIDELSRPLDPELTFPLAAISVGARRLVKGADTSRVVDLLAKVRGWSVRVTSPGELHLLQRLTECGAEVAGEGNGGVVLPRVGATRDGLAAAVSILALVATSDTRVSQLAAELPRLVRRRVSLPCTGREAATDALMALAERLGSEVNDPEEGVALDRPGQGWALVRQSATEPVLRITVESSEEMLADEIYAEVRAALPVSA